MKLLSEEVFLFHPTSCFSWQKPVQDQQMLPHSFQSPSKLPQFASTIIVWSAPLKEWSLLLFFQRRHTSELGTAMESSLSPMIIPGSSLAPSGKVVKTPRCINTHTPEAVSRHIWGGKVLIDVLYDLVHGISISARSQCHWRAALSHWQWMTVLGSWQEQCCQRQRDEGERKRCSERSTISVWMMS